MAEFNKENLQLFIDYNRECEIEGLIEWIAELLPQKTFNDYIADIKSYE